MEAIEYAKLQQYESTYWWYLAQRANVVEAVRSLNLPPGAKVLDAGCGTGRNLKEISAALDVVGYGIDASPHAAASWNGTTPLHASLASINEIPFADDAFDAVVSVDVLGCRGVNAGSSITEIARVLRPGGYAVLLVPAYQWLLSRHDVAVHSVHRFTGHELGRLISSAGLTLEHLTHRFMFLFPIIAAMRLWRKLPMAPNLSNPTSDLSPIPNWLNRWLLAVTTAERKWLSRRALPFGSTILVIARKAGA
ncbi:MAG: methyltransferase domain-containing protein [Planctomycetota bacterium]